MLSDIIPVIHKLRKDLLDTHETLEEHCEVSCIRDLLLQLERHFEEFHKISLVKSLRESIYSDLDIENACKHGHDTTMFFQKKGYSTTRKKIISDLLTELSRDFDPNALLRYDLSAFTSKKAKTGEYAMFNFDDIPPYEPLEHTLEILRASPHDQTALLKLIEMDPGELFEHPQWQELVKVLSNSTKFIPDSLETTAQNLPIVAHFHLISSLNDQQSIDLVTNILFLMKSRWCDLGTEISLRDEDFLSDPQLSLIDQTLVGGFVVLLKETAQKILHSDPGRIDELVATFFIILCNGRVRKLGSRQSGDIIAYRLLTLVAVSTAVEDLFGAIARQWSPTAVLSHAVHSGYMTLLLKQINSTVLSLKSEQPGVQEFPSSRVLIVTLRKFTMAAYHWLQLLLPFSHQGPVTKLCCDLLISKDSSSSGVAQPTDAEAMKADKGRDRPEFSLWDGKVHGPEAATEKYTRLVPGFPIMEHIAGANRKFLQLSGATSLIDVLCAPLQASAASVLSSQLHSDGMSQVAATTTATTATTATTTVTAVAAAALPEDTFDATLLQIAQSVEQLLLHIGNQLSRPATACVGVSGEAGGDVGTAAMQTLHKDCVNRCMRVVQSLLVHAAAAVPPTPQTSVDFMAEREGPHEAVVLEAAPRLAVPTGQRILLLQSCWRILGLPATAAAAAAASGVDTVGLVADAAYSSVSAEQLFIAFVESLWAVSEDVLRYFTVEVQLHLSAHMDMILKQWALAIEVFLTDWSRPAATMLQLQIIFISKFARFLRQLSSSCVLSLGKSHFAHLSQLVAGVSAVCAYCCRHLPLYSSPYEVPESHDIVLTSGGPVYDGDCSLVQPPTIAKSDALGGSGMSKDHERCTYSFFTAVLGDSVLCEGLMGETPQLTLEAARSLVILLCSQSLQWHQVRHDQPHFPICEDPIAVVRALLVVSSTELGRSILWVSPHPRTATHIQAQAQAQALPHRLHAKSSTASAAAPSSTESVTSSTTSAITSATAVATATATATATAAAALCGRPWLVQALEAEACSDSIWEHAMGHGIGTARISEGGEKATAAADVAASYERPTSLGSLIELLLGLSLAGRTDDVLSLMAQAWPSLAEEYELRCPATMERALRPAESGHVVEIDAARFTAALAVDEFQCSIAVEGLWPVLLSVLFVSLENVDFCGRVAMWAQEKLQVGSDASKEGGVEPMALASPDPSRNSVIQGRDRSYGDIHSNSSSHMYSGSDISQDVMAIDGETDTGGADSRSSPPVHEMVAEDLVSGGIGLGIEQIMMTTYQEKMALLASTTL